MMFLPVFLSLLVIHWTTVKAYPTGAPLEACGQMFPTGHNANAQSTPPPYTLTADKTTFTTGDTITLWLNSTNDATFPVYEGVFVQARLVSNCSNTTPVGTFSLEAGETYLKLLHCVGIQNSTVTHMEAQKTNSKKFTWTPSVATQGHIFFRATVVFETPKFWTNVFTPVIVDTRDTTATPATVTCKAQTTGSASSIAAVASLVFAGVITFLALH